jgi:hypothetical protein
MVRRTTSLPKQILFYVVIVCFLSGCPTVGYHKTQDDFNRRDYQKVSGDLTDTNIQALDPKLQFNAYTMKAYSEWQNGKLAEAKQTAATAMGQSDLVAGPRDKFFLSILPTLVDLQELINKYQQLPKPKNISVQSYKNDYEKGYMKVVASLKNAYTQAPTEVPPTSLEYAHCKRGDALMAWRAVIENIWDGADNMSDATMDLREDAQKQAQQFLQGTRIKDEISKERKFRCPEAKEILTAKATP